MAYPGVRSCAALLFLFATIRYHICPETSIPAKKRDLRRVARQLVRRFEDHGQSLKGRVAQNAPERLESQISLPDFFVPVLVRAAWIFAVVQMQRLQAVKANDAVEFRQHAVQIVCCLYSDDRRFGIA